MNNGRVALVGAGCGADLITVKGLRALQSADTVIYDALIDKGLLLETKSGAEVIFVGKRAGRHSMSQNEVQNLLISKAREGKFVVRLKGGDSFVFGRGGEEAASLSCAGIPYTVIPGVTSAVAVPEFFGIPVTHRNIARSFTVVTGHTAEEVNAPNCGEDYRALAELRGTLVFLMGLSNAETICRKLIEHGKSENTPAAILSCGYFEGARRIDGTLGNIFARANEAEPPAILVAGETAQFDFSDTASLPLSATSVIVTGTREFALSLSRKIRMLGGYALPVETVEILPMPDNVPTCFSHYSWIVFTSANGVRVFFNTLLARHIDYRSLSGLKIACVGPKTAEILREYGIICDFVPNDYSGTGVGDEICSDGAPQKPILVLCAENGGDSLSERLLARKIPFESRKIYASAPKPHGGVECDTDYIVFSSASGVRSFFRSGGNLNGAVPVCIGGGTASCLSEYGISNCLISNQHDGDGIITTILEDKKKEQI